MLSIKSVVFLAAVLHTSHCKDFLPSYIEPCDLEKEYVECIKGQIVKALPHFTRGIPELGVPPIDPVDLDDIIIDGNGLKLVFTKPKFHGLKDAKLTKWKVVIGRNDEAFTLGIKTDVKLTAKYEVDGRILILPIVGKGDALVDVKNVEVTIDGNLTHVKDAKGEHFKLITPSYKYDIEKTTFKLDNLFNGNKQLADTTIQFANENWKQLMDELAPPAIKQIVKTIIKVINKFFTSVTIQQILKHYDTFIRT